LTASKLSQGKLIWCGEHWINYIRPAGDTLNTGMVSLYHGYYSPVGQGTVAYVDIPEDSERSAPTGFTAVCTDNHEYARFIDAQMIRSNPYLKNSPWLPELPIHDAQFTFNGDTGEAPSWTIDTGGRCIVASWSSLNQSFVGPPTIHPQIIFTILFFAEQASIEIDGHTVPGEPYQNEAWAQSLEVSQSSCVFALAETMIEAS
jgi:hypothetical protein